VPFIALALVAGILAVAYSTMRHRHLGPLLITIAGSAAIASGRLVWNISAVASTGGGAVLGAAIWNLWLSRSRPQHIAIRHARSKGEIS